MSDAHTQAPHRAAVSPRLSDADGLAVQLGVSRDTVDVLRETNRIPFIRIDEKTIRYEIEHVLDCLNFKAGDELRGRKCDDRARETDEDRALEVE